MKIIVRYPTEITVVLISIFITSFTFLPSSVYHSFLGEIYYTTSFLESILFILLSISTFLIGLFVCGKTKWRGTYLNGPITRRYAYNLRLILAIWTLSSSIVFLLYIWVC